MKKIKHIIATTVFIPAVFVMVFTISLSINAAERDSHALGKERPVINPILKQYMKGISSKFGEQVVKGLSPYVSNNLKKDTVLADELANDVFCFGRYVGNKVAKELYIFLYGLWSLRGKGKDNDPGKGDDSKDKDPGKGDDSKDKDPGNEKNLDDFIKKRKKEFKLLSTVEMAASLLNTCVSSQLIQSVSSGVQWGVGLNWMVEDWRENNQGFLPDCILDNTYVDTIVQSPISNFIRSVAVKTYILIPLVSATIITGLSMFA